MGDGKIAGARKGDFIAPREVPEFEEATDRLPSQEEFFRPPVRFGSVPVEEKPLGFDSKRGYKKLFPPVMLPTQVVERVSFGHSELEPNRLFWGDNLHVMRSLPSESIDLIYIDPPFFSGRNYNVIFGDKNELRSFSDIWEGGMSGYLIWLNARLIEMKRLLKNSGSIFVHLDWHASHYVKLELDKIFGHGGINGKGPGFKNEIIWSYRSGGNSKTTFARKHDTILFYSKSKEYLFNVQYYKSWQKKKYNYNPKYPEYWDEEEQSWYHLSICRDVWEDVNVIGTDNKERIGYPTQKPEALLRRIIEATTNEGDVVADFFIGGGTTAAVAQRLGRRWIACDQSRVAVAITADRLTKIGEQPQLSTTDTPSLYLAQILEAILSLLSPTSPSSTGESMRKSDSLKPRLKDFGSSCFALMRRFLMQAKRAFTVTKARSPFGLANLA